MTSLTTTRRAVARTPGSPAAVVAPAATTIRTRRRSKLSLQQQINLAIKQGVKWLKARQDKERFLGARAKPTARYGEAKKLPATTSATNSGRRPGRSTRLSKCGVKKHRPRHQEGAEVPVGPDQVRLRRSQGGKKAADRSNFDKLRTPVSKTAAAFADDVRVGGHRS